MPNSPPPPPQGPPPNQFATLVSPVPDPPVPLPPGVPPPDIRFTGVTSASRPLPTVPGYEILGELGRGGMGVVYKARQTRLNRLVALKMIIGGLHADPAAAARFRTEAEAIARVKHPNIVQVYDVGECDGNAYLALELVDGESLERVLATAPPDPAAAARLVELLALGIHSAHELNIVHRDLKPANVLMTRDGVPKITDFGLAKRLEDQSGQTQSGSILGTPSFMAPEQAAGKTREVGPAADVYGLGGILYTALSGRPPFTGETVLDTIIKVQHEDPLPPSRVRPAVPRDLETICLKCLAKAPAQRYHSSHDLAADLRRFIDGEPILARRLGPAERAWRWCRKNPVPATLLLAMALGFVYLHVLSRSLTQDAALDSAAQQAEMLTQLNTFYTTEVVERAKAGGVEPTHEYKEKHGRPVIPAPATLNIDLGRYISDRSELGQRVRVYSDYPFPNRKADGGPHDGFEREALDHFRTRPTEPFYRFEPVDGRVSLRYAVAQIMKPDCVRCHNSHRDSPKKDWKVGDVRGVLELVRPLDKDIQRVWSGLGWTVSLMAGVSVSLLTFFLLPLLMERFSRPSEPARPAGNHVAT